MNDPHVVALIYQVEHGRSVDYSKAKPLDHKEAGFRIKVKDGLVRFEFKDHYAMEEAARAAIEDYIREWEFAAGLCGGPGYFRLRFDCAEIEDRDPTPGVVELYGGTSRISFTTSKGRLLVSPPRYPPPPSGVRLSADVESMYDRYIGHLQDKEPLEGMAYFCLTVLEALFKGVRKEAAKRYNISRNVLNKIGELSSRRGCRKAEGMKESPLTDQERRFLEEATKAMIYRAAEKAHNPDSDLRKITLSDFPRV